MDENIVFMFEIKRDGEEASDIFHAKVAPKDTGTGVGGEVVAFTKRQRVDPPEGATRQEEKAEQPYISYDLQETKSYGNTDGEVRKAINTTPSQPVIHMHLPISQTTFKREIKAVTGYMKDTRLVKKTEGKTGAVAE